MPGNLTTIVLKPLMEEFEIVSYGNRNGASGPDFINAAISMAGLKWYGNIEMHVRSSDWKKHGHHNDEAYDNVILHVVWIHDMDPTDGKRYPFLSYRP